MSDSSLPPQALDEIRATLRAREEGIAATVLARSALELLGVTSDSGGQTKGVLAVQGQHEKRIGDLERTLRSLSRVSHLVAMACVAIILWIVVGFYDRWESRQSMAERPQQAALVER